MSQCAVAELHGREQMLVVDDEPRIRSLIETRLHEPADLVILDLMLLRLDGYGVLETLRAVSEAPVLMVTACAGASRPLNASVWTAAPGQGGNDRLARLAARLPADSPEI